MMWHKPDRTTISIQEFDSKLKDILMKDKWIIDGNYNRTLEIRLKYCDTVFLMDFPKESLPRIYELIEKYQENKRVVIF